MALIEVAARKMAQSRKSFGQNPMRVMQQKDDTMISLKNRIFCYRDARYWSSKLCATRSVIAYLPPVAL